MAARAYWCDETERLIILEFENQWTKEDYKEVMDESIVMLQSVSHPAVVIQNYITKRRDAFSSAVIKIFLDTHKAWKETENYADFWVTVSYGYWERIFILALSSIYNPTDLIIVSSLERACELALKRLEGLKQNT